MNCLCQPAALLLATLLAALLTGCAPGARPLSVPFALTAGGRAAGCGAPATLADGRRVSLQDLRLFVHDVQVRDARGGWQPLALTADGRFQSEVVALLDFEDGQAGCRNGNAPTWTALQGSTAAHGGAGLRFRIGVPFAENHADPSQATSPLSTTSMHWS